MRIQPVEQYLKRTRQSEETSQLRIYYAFSLVELLVSVAIIGLLVTIVVPSIGRARDKTKLAICKSHLRNLGIAARMYAYDNTGVLPMAEKLDNPHKSLLGALSGRNYIGDFRIYYCPSMTDPELCYCEENVDACNISYFYVSCHKATTNRFVSTFLRWSVTWPRRLSFTMEPEMWIASDSWFSGEPTAHRYYKKGINYLMLDGSVQMLTRGPRSKFK